MTKKKILGLFIFSFVCMVFSLNNLCFKYADNKVSAIFSNHNSKIEQIDNFHTKAVYKSNENHKLLITLSLSCLFFLIIVFIEKVPISIIFSLFIIAYFAAYKLILSYTNTDIGLIAPIISLFIAILYSIAYKEIFKEKIERKIEEILGKYISKDISEKILKDNVNAELGGKRAEITVMFADIRGFTTLSEKLKAEEVSELLNEYFSALEPIIIKYKGVINKYIGDAVLVIFGESNEDKEHAKNAVKCAYEMKKKVKEIREKWIAEGKPKIDIGIGLNTGEAFIGNIGTKNRFEYTVIGDTVNIASRIEDYNKIYKTHVLISENTYRKISQVVDVIKIREVSIKGKSQKINIYEVLRITD